METLAQNHSPCQELLFDFFFSPPSKCVSLLSAGRIINAPKFNSGLNPSDYFDLSQDPPLPSYDAFTTKWPWLKGATCDTNIIKYPDALPRPGNPHHIAHIIICFVLQPGLSATITDGKLAINSCSTALPTPRSTPSSGHKAKVIQLKTHRTAPQDVIKWCARLYGKGKWKKVLRGAYRYSRYKQRSQVKQYPGKSRQKGSFYPYGQYWLAGQLGVSRWTVQRWFQVFEHDDIITYPYIGYKGRHSSVVELPYNVAHIMANKRKPKKP